jgi:hypothetical protein
MCFLLRKAFHLNALLSILSTSFLVLALPNAPLYRLAPRETEEIERQLQQLLNASHIQPNCSPCTSPAFIIPKKESGEWHLVIDYWYLNKITLKNRYPLPRIKDLLDQLKGAKYFTKMDLTTGYHQVHMDATHTWKTTFKTRFGLYEWMVMPFGLTNALPHSKGSSMIYFVLCWAALWSFIWMAFWYSVQTWEEHLQHVN